MTAETPEDLTDDLFFGGAVRLLQPRRGHRFGGDAALLAAAARSLMAEGAMAVDLGAGVGAVGLALCAKGAGRATLVEIDPELVALARDNARRNGMAERATVLCADVAELGLGDGLAGGAELVAMNPPFDDGARHRPSPDDRKARAHVDQGDVAPVWIATAARLLADGGALAIIHRPEALPKLLTALDGPFGDLRVKSIHPRAEASAGRALVVARKGARGPLALKPPLVMHGPDGRFSAEAEAAQRGGVLDMA